MKIRKTIKTLLKTLPVIKHWYRTRGTAAAIKPNVWFYQKVLGFNKTAYWPMHFSSVVNGVENIKIGIGTAPGLAPGCYIQGTGKIEIGDYTIIAPNVGIISANHSLYDYSQHEKGSVIIGRYCWIGMNSIIMPNVVLGDHTIVAGGAVVTKKFEGGYCVIGGNPAKIIKNIEKSRCIENTNEFKYKGYLFQG